MGASAKPSTEIDGNACAGDACAGGAAAIGALNGCALCGTLLATRSPALLLAGCSFRSSKWLSRRLAATKSVRASATGRTASAHARLHRCRPRWLGGVFTRGSVASTRPNSRNGRDGGRGKKRRILIRGVRPPPRPSLYVIFTPRHPTKHARTRSARALSRDTYTMNPAPSTHSNMLPIDPSVRLV